MTFNKSRFIAQANAYIMLFRLKTIPAAICPLFMSFGLAYKQGAMQWLIAFFIFLTALGLQISCNIANDYFDCINEKDTAKRLGPQRVSATGLLPIARVKTLVYASFLITFLLGLVLMFYGGIVISILGISALLAAFLYTGGPYPYGYVGLGDIFVFIFFGPVAVGASYYLLTGNWDIYAFSLSLSPGLLSVALLATNNLRDRQEDLLSNKRSLAVLFGALFCKIQITLCVIIACLWPALLYGLYQRYVFTNLSILSIILAIPILKIIWSQSGDVLNNALFRLSKLLLSFTILYLCGLYLS